MEQPPKEEQHQEGSQPIGSTTVETKETVPSGSGAAETGLPEAKALSSTDLATSVQTIIGHLNEGLDTIQKASTGEAPAEKVSELDGLKKRFNDQLKRIKEQEKSLVSTEQSEPRVAQLSKGLESYDKELQSVLEKLKSSLAAGQTEASVTITELSTSLDTAFKNTLSGFQSLPPNAPATTTEDDEITEITTGEHAVVLAGAEGEIFQDRRTLYRNDKSTGSVTVVANEDAAVKEMVIQTDPITQDLLDRVGYVQLITESCDQGPFTDLVTTTNETEEPKEEGEGEKKEEKATDEEDKTRPDPGENGTWFELVVMSPNTTIPAELLKGPNELGPDDVSLAQETKDVLIRVLYGGRYLPKPRPKDSVAHPASNDKDAKPADASTSTEEPRQPNAPTRRLTQFAGEGTEESTPDLRYVSHHNTAYAQPAQTITGPMFSRNHELWKWLEVGDVIGVWACAKGERWKNEVTSVDLNFWQHSD